MHLSKYKHWKVQKIWALERGFYKNCEGWLDSKFVGSTQRPKRDKHKQWKRKEGRKKSLKKTSDLLLHSGSSNSLLIENAKPLLQDFKRVFLRGMGTLQVQLVWGRELVPILRLPLTNGYFAPSPLWLCREKHHPFSIPFSLLLAEFILSLGYCGEWRVNQIRGGQGSLGSHLQVSLKRTNTIAGFWERYHKTGDH